MRHTVSAVLFAILIPAAALGQVPAETPTIPQHNQIISANPFGLVVKWQTVEFERKIAPETSLGVAASRLGDFGEWSGEILLRWYPAESAPDGFYLGVHGGAYAFNTYSYAVSTFQQQTSVLPGAGVEIGYNWLLGPKHNVSVGTGFGLTRVADNRGSYSPTVLPGFRLNVGFAF